VHGVVKMAVSEPRARIFVGAGKIQSDLAVWPTVALM